ncbi:DUF4145 domain-containing protein [Paenibacillus sp. UKAQ_18]|nr:DUF4145 domain-containing protein [Paenibacillus sp. UKAQ_18]
MVIDCPFCDITVEAVEKGTVIIYMDEIQDKKTVLLECPKCGEAIGAQQRMVYFNGTSDWSRAIRIWPSAQRNLSVELPDIVSISLEEAEKCYKATAYLACAVMCRRVIESICLDKQVKKNSIFSGLKELLDTKVIDEKIYEWSNVLRLHGNIGAHPSSENINKEDATDLLEFTIAICDYIYVLTKKFDDFMNRKIKVKNNELSAEV